MRTTVSYVLALCSMLILALSACESPSERQTPVALKAALGDGSASDPWVQGLNTTLSQLELPAGEARYLTLTLPADHQGLRIAFRASEPVTAYLRVNTPTGTITHSVSQVSRNTFFVAPSNVHAERTYILELRSNDGASVDTQAEPTYSQALSWDEGSTLLGNPTTKPAAHFGDALFHIQSQTSQYGLWRHVVRLNSGEAALAVAPNTLPYLGNGHSADEVGSDLVLLNRYSFQPGQTWYVRVIDQGDADWTLLSGDVFVHQLGSIGDATPAHELTFEVGGLAWFRTEASASTAAWRLSTEASNTLYIHDSELPHPTGSAPYIKRKEGLLVPPFLTTKSYFGLIKADSRSASTTTLISRNHVIRTPTSVPNAQGNTFSFTLSDTDDEGYGYVTYRVDVPVQQIAWQVSATSLTGEVDLYVSRNSVPSPEQNHALSELTGVGDSITLVPPTLTNGAFYVTLHGQAPFSFTLNSGNPDISPISYTSSTPNGPAHEGRSGWRYYVINDVDSQIGHLGWLLELSQHQPNTEIAMRRNGVPSRWKYRSWGYSYTIEQSELAHSSRLGFLERPNHQADIWYIGVHQDQTHLGPFELHTQALTSTELPFHGGEVTVTQQPSGRWKFFHVEVPEDSTTLGWNVRLEDVTQGDPRAVIRATSLPESWSQIPSYYDFLNNSSWPNGSQYPFGSHFSGRSDAGPQGVSTYGRHFLASMHKPLSPGTYYIGVSNTHSSLSNASDMSYRLRSHSIGDSPSHTLGVESLDFYAGSDTVLDLPSGELKAYRIHVPDQAERWRLNLDVLAGEAFFIIAPTRMPNERASITNVWANGRSQTQGSEQLYLVPSYYDGNTLPPGDWIVLVGSEGEAQNTYYNYPGLASFTLSSQGDFAIAQATVDAATPAVFAGQSVAKGEVKLFEVFAPSQDINSLEFALEGAPSSARITVSGDSYPSRTTDYTYTPYYGGRNNLGTSPNLVTLNHSYSRYRILVEAPLEAIHEATVRVTARGDEVLPFNDGVLSVTGQPYNAWRYFKVEVPEGALGWDVRLHVAGGKPRMVVARDTLPTDFNTTYYFYFESRQNWPSGYQYGVGYGYAQRQRYDNSNVGTEATFSMGYPLEPGTYFVGVSGGSHSSGEPPLDYTIVSRGIGIGENAQGQPWSIQVQPLDFENGQVTATVEVSENAYYYVDVPEGVSSWQYELRETDGYTAISSQADGLPNSHLPSHTSHLYTRRLDQLGDEFAYVYPQQYEASTLEAKRVFMVVHALGQPHELYPYSYLGEGLSTFTLHSIGERQVETLTEPLTTTHTFEAQTLRRSEQKIYRIQVPAGATSLLVKLKNVSPLAAISVRQGLNFYSPWQHHTYPATTSYYSYQYAHANTLTIAEPSGEYLLTVVASGESPSTTYDLEVSLQGEEALAFNGGSQVVSGHSPNSWRYFNVEVPEDALGWHLRLEDIVSNAYYRPTLVVSREVPPDSPSTSPSSYPGMPNYTRWESGWRWVAPYDLSFRYYGPYQEWPNSAQNLTNTAMVAGMGAPLMAGSYVVGVYLGEQAGEDASYRIVSDGIGAGLDSQGQAWTSPVERLSPGDVAELVGLSPREHVFYRVDVPEGSPGFRLKLEMVQGDAALTVRRDTIPSATGPTSYSDDTGWGVATGHGSDIAGNDYFYRVPSDAADFKVPGTYYVAVVAQGQPHPTASNMYLGTGETHARLHVDTITFEHPLEPLPALEDQPLSFAPAHLENGEYHFYRVRIPSEVPAFEVRLSDTVGQPIVSAAVNPWNEGKIASNTWNSYNRAQEGGVYPQASGSHVLTLAGYTGDLDLSVAAYMSQYAPSHQYTLTVTPKTIHTLTYDGHEESRQLKDGETVYYRLEVPADCGTFDRPGWIFRHALDYGQVSIELRKDYLPGDPKGNTTTYSTTSREAVLTPPNFSPGLWYVAVKANQASSLTIETEEIKARRHWTMPERDQAPTAPGLVAPRFADTGISDVGTPIINPNTQDQGTDLAQGHYHFYRITMPEVNGGLLKTRLDAISGNPNLYIRHRWAPSLTSLGYYWNQHYTYADTLTGSSYGHWGLSRVEDTLELPAGEYWLAVYAEASNVRYRLYLETDNAQAVALNGGSVSGHTLAAGDMRHYTFEVPALSTVAATSMPTSWTLHLNERSGDVMVRIREQSPAAFTNHLPDPYSADYYLAWLNSDISLYAYTSETLKLDATGSLTISAPLLRPGVRYYASVYAKSDAVYDLSSSVASTTYALDGEIAWPNGSLNISLAAGESRTYRIQMPAEAAYMKAHLQSQGQLVATISPERLAPSNFAYVRGWYSNSWGGSPHTFEQPLLTPSYTRGNHPFVPNAPWYVHLSNPDTTSRTFSLELEGLNADDDSDQDGLPDGWELKHFGALYYGGNDDYDHDGLSNAQEFALGSSPRNIDTDGDGLNDNDEVFTGASPIVADSDNDGTCDPDDSHPNDPNEAGRVLRLVMHRYTDGEYGLGYGDNSYKTRLVATFASSNHSSYWLHVRGLSLSQADDIEVYVNNVFAGYLPTAAPHESEALPVVFMVPSHLIRYSGDNRLELRARSGLTQWGVTDLGLFTYGQSFGVDSSKAYDNRHPHGFELRSLEEVDHLLELQAYKLQTPEALSIKLHDTHAQSRAFLTSFGLHAPQGWTASVMVPFVDEGLATTTHALRINPPAGGADWQLRIANAYGLTQSFGRSADRGYGDAIVDTVHFALPAGQLRQLSVLSQAQEGQALTFSDGQTSVRYESDSYWTHHSQTYVSSPTESRLVTVNFEEQSPLSDTYYVFLARLSYAGPCGDLNYDGVNDCELCEDFDQDQVFAASPLCPSGDDCNDNDPSLGSRSEDADCDGVPTWSDCDDEDASLGDMSLDSDCDGRPDAEVCPNGNLIADDNDCDGALAADDCDDSDPSKTYSWDFDANCDGILDGDVCPNGHLIADDSDCDGALNPDDCDDNDPSKTYSWVLDANCDGIPDADVCPNGHLVADDNDCDGVLAADDCDDNDPTKVLSLQVDTNCDGIPDADMCPQGHPRLTDMDCDGILSDFDCDDNDPTRNRPRHANDWDCDGVATPLDCNDFDHTNTQSRVGDGDCDGVPTSLDCNDTDPSDTRSNEGDKDCDGLPTELDCNDNDASNTQSRAGDQDCDGSPTASDCDDNDPTVQECPVCVDLDEDGHYAASDTCPTGNDCDDSDPNSTTVDVDADCDGILTEQDCNDEDPDSLAVSDDADCDGVLTADDCDDSSPTLGAREDDFDCDGVLNEHDNCPSEANPDQRDQDADGIGDACEECFGPDSDGDLVPDSCDVCPNAYDDQRDSNGDGIGDACTDSDKDGLVDSKDNCPEVYNPNQADSDRDGIGDACAPNPPTPNADASSSGCQTSTTSLLGLLLALVWVVRQRRAFRR